MKKIFNKNNIRIAVSVLLAFVTCIFLFVTAISASLLYSFKQDTVVSSVKSSGYTDHAIKELTLTLNDLAIPSGLPTTFFNDKIDKKEFEALFLECLNNTIQKKNFSVNTADFEKKVLDLVTEYSVSVSGDYSSEVQESIESFTHECAGIYLTYVNPPAFSYVFPLLPTLSKYLLWVNIAAAVLSVIGIVALWRINTLRSLGQYCFASTVGAFLTCSALPAYLLITNELSRVSISAKSLHAAFTQYAGDILSNIILFALPFIVTSFIILFFEIKHLIFKR